MTAEELLAGSRTFALPLKREFRGVTVREGLLIEGPSGWGEFAPFLDHSDEHAARWLQAAIEQAFGDWPQSRREAIPVNAIIPSTDAFTTRRLVEEALESGCTTVKTKVGSDDFDDDVARVSAIREALDAAGVTGAIRIDTNQRWTLAQAKERISILDAIAQGLEYVEQPIADRQELRELRRHVSVPIAIDEGVRLSADPLRAAREMREHADVAVLKAIPLGGVEASLRVAEACALPVVVSGSLDTSVGLAAGLQLAACLPELPYACGLGTGSLFTHDVIGSAQSIRDGYLQIGRVVPEDANPLGLVDDAMRERWRARLQRAWQHAGSPELGV